MFESADQSGNLIPTPDPGNERFFSKLKTTLARIEYYSKPLSLILIAVIVILLLVKPEWVHLNIDYSNITSDINALKTPQRIKKILLFLVYYNVFFLLSGLFGAAVGASEILSRYRDEPFIAISSPPGRRYLAVNAGISLAAFYLLHYFGERIFPGISNDRLLMSLVAGFGAMIVMRSKIFNFKTESGESYAIGPDAVLSIFLTSVDRQIDRYRASRRQSLVYEETQNVENPASAPDFLRSFLVSYQNLSNQERSDIDESVRRIYENQADLRSPRLKFMTAAFGFLNIMGEGNFRALVQQLKKYQLLGEMPQAVPKGNVPPGGGGGAASGAPIPPQPFVPNATGSSSSTPAGTTKVEDAKALIGTDESLMPLVKKSEAEIAPATGSSTDTSGNATLTGKSVDTDPVENQSEVKVGEIAGSSEEKATPDEVPSEIAEGTKSDGTDSDQGKG